MFHCHFYSKITSVRIDELYGHEGTSKLLGKRRRVIKLEEVTDLCNFIISISP